MNETAKQPEPGSGPANVGGAQDNLAVFLSLPPPPRVFLRKEEIIPWLGVSKTTVEEWMRCKVIPVVKVGKMRLFNVIAVERALERFSAKAIGDSQKP